MRLNGVHCTIINCKRMKKFTDKLQSLYEGPPHAGLNYKICGHCFIFKEFFVQ
jgi:hypothetical protein